MKAKDFQALLLRAAVVAMAADGEVANEEKQELARIAGSTAYFLGFDYPAYLPQLLADPENVGPYAIASLARAVKAASLSERRVPVLLEVVLRVIEADQVVRPAERSLLAALTSALAVTDSWLFGHYPRLMEYRQGSSPDLRL